jgi:hypothetical protein
MSLLVHEDTWTVKLPLPEGGGVNVCAGADSFLCVDRDGAGVGVDVDGTGVAGAVAAGSRLGSGVGAGVASHLRPGQQSRAPEADR